MKVYQAIAAVSGEMAKTGISKDHSNQQQGYKFRGIDDVYNALAPLLSKHGLVVLPRMTGRTVTERVTPKGGVLFYVNVDAEFDFVAAEDGSKHTVRTFGEAMDSGDKATNKAMSAAYKYAAFQTFCIPTDGDNDADAKTHTVAPEGAVAGPLRVIDVYDEPTQKGAARWRVKLSDGRLTTTFKSQLADLAVALQREECEVKAEVTQGAYGLDLKGLKRAVEPVKPTVDVPADTVGAF